MKSRRMNRKSRKTRKGGTFGVHKWKTWGDNKNNCNSYHINGTLPDGKKVDCQDNDQINKYNFPSNRFIGLKKISNHLITTLDKPYPGQKSPIQPPYVRSVQPEITRSDQPPKRLDQPPKRSIQL